MTSAGLRVSTWWLPVVAFNLVPIAGVLWLGWDLGLILLLYWAENGLVGLSNLAKIVAARGSVAADPAPTAGAQGRRLRGAPRAVAGSIAEAVGGPLMRAGIAVSFAVHYGMFWAVHGVFVFLIANGAFFGRPPLAGMSPGVTGSFWLALAGLAVLRIVELAQWFRDRDDARISPAKQAGEPYRRVIVLHLAIVLGGVLVATLGQPILLLAVLVAVKIVIELGLERRTLAGRSTGA